MELQTINAFVINRVSGAFCDAPYTCNAWYIERDSVKIGTYTQGRKFVLCIYSGRVE